MSTLASYGSCSRFKGWGELPLPSGFPHHQEHCRKRKQQEIQRLVSSCTSCSGKYAAIDCLHNCVRSYQVLALTVPNHQRSMTEFADHPSGAVRGIQCRLYCFLFEDSLVAACTRQFLFNVFSSFFFGIPFEIVIHDNALPQRLVYG